MLAITKTHKTDHTINISSGCALLILNAYLKLVQNSKQTLRLITTLHHQEITGIKPYNTKYAVKKLHL